MFRAEFMIDDRDVVKLHYELAKLRVFNVEVQPVVNAKKHNGKVVAEHPTGFLKDRLTEAVRERFKSMKSPFTRAAIDEIVKELGGSPTSGLIKLLVDNKTIRRKQRGFFTLVTTK